MSGRDSDSAASGPELTTGKRVWFDPQERQPLFWGIVASLTLCLFVNIPYILLGATIASFIVRSKVLWGILVVVYSMAFCPAQRHWRGFIDGRLMRSWRRYFSFSGVITEPLDPKKNYMICEFPHGVFPFGPVVAGSIVDDYFPGMTVYSVAASVLFKTPFYRHFMSWIGAAPATKSNFKKLLNKGSCAVIVGGVAEMYMQDDHKERVKLLSRKGFVKVALESGVDLVPLYHFGNSRAMDVLGVALKNLSRKLRMSLVMYYGLWYLPIPRPVPIMMAMGKPIPVKQMSRDDPGFGDELDRLHSEFCKELESTYNRFRGMYGWDERPLSIE